MDFGRRIENVSDVELAEKRSSSFWLLIISFLAGMLFIFLGFFDPFLFLIGFVLLTMSILCKLNHLQFYLEEHFRKLERRKVV